MSVPHDIRGVSCLDILLYPGDFRMLSDVTCVVATPTALGQLVQCPYSSAMNMLGRLRSLLGREKGEGKETRERQTQAGLQPQCKTTRKKWSRRWYRASKEPPPTPTSLTKKQVKQKVKSLTTQLQVMTAQRNDLRDRLILVTEGSLDNRYLLFQNPWAGLLRHSDVGDQSWLTWSYYLECVSSDLQSRLLMEQRQLKKKLDMLRQEKENLLEDWVLLKHHSDDLQVLSKGQEETSDLQNQQQQIGQAAGSQ
nr:uncharacterized protein LOC107401192 [Peromyscus maniculatus bairdii]